MYKYNYHNEAALYLPTLRSYMHPSHHPLHYTHGKVLRILSQTLGLTHPKHEVELVLIPRLPPRRVRLPQGPREAVGVRRVTLRVTDLYGAVAFEHDLRACMRV